MDFKLINSCLKGKKIFMKKTKQASSMRCVTHR